MGRIKKLQIKQLSVFILSTLIIIFVGSLIFILTAPPQSYILFIFFFILAVNLTLTIIGKRFVLSIKLKKISSKLHIFPSILTTILLILHLSNFYVVTINIVLYIIVFFLIPGITILSILNFKPKSSKVETIALAYPLSIVLVSSIGTFTLFLPSKWRGTLTLLVITGLSFLSLFKSLKKEKVDKYFLTIKNDKLILAIVFFILTYFYLKIYPAIVNFPGLDISRNFLYALAFTKNAVEDFYAVPATYPLFSVYQSYIIYIVKPSVTTFQTTFVFLNLFNLLTFYIMANQYLKKYGNSTSAIATLIWATFAGFGWLNFLTRKINNPDASTLLLTAQTDIFSYGDITWRRLFFHLPMEVSLVLVFAVLYLLSRNDLNKSKQIFLITLLMTPLPLMHPYATYFLFLTLICFAIIGVKQEWQLKCSAFSLMVAAFTSLILNYILALKTQSITINFLFFEYLLMGIFILTILTFRNKIPKKIFMPKTGNFTKKHTIILATTISLLFFYFLSILLWFNENLTFNFFSLNLFGYVPWFMYPVKLGITGVIVIIVVAVIAMMSNREKEIITIIFLLAFMILISKLVSVIQLQYISEFTFDPNSFFDNIRRIVLSFREERMFELYKIPLAIVSSIFLSEHVLGRLTKRKNTKLLSYLAVVGLVSLILISGMSSTLLGFEYYYKVTVERQPNQQELSIIHNLREKVYANGKSIIISPQTPAAYLDFTGATTIKTESPAAWKSECPEIPLFFIRYKKTTPTYIYLHKTRDYQLIKRYHGNYLAHLGKLALVCMENSKVQIKMIKNYSIPTPQSSAALVIPYDNTNLKILNKEQIFYAYDFLSYACFNYTTILSTDKSIKNYKTLILPYDDIFTYEFLTKFKANLRKIETHSIIVINTNGYGPLLKFFGNLSSKSFKANGILINNYYYPLKKPVTSPTIKPHAKTKIVGYYTNGQLRSPLAMLLPQKQLIYVNIYPLLSQLPYLDLQSLFKNSLGYYLDSYNETTITPWFLKPSMLFKKAEINGTIQIFPKSIAFIKIQENNSVSVHTKTTNYTIKSITAINIDTCTRVKINSSKVVIQKGYGFYTTLKVYNPLITLSGDSIVFINGGIKIKGQEILLKINGDVELLVRQPKILIKGESMFKDFYMLHPPIIYTNGRNVKLSGIMDLNMYASDEYTVVLPYRFSSLITITYEKPLIKFS